VISTRTEMRAATSTQPRRIVTCNAFERLWRKEMLVGQLANSSEPVFVLRHARQLHGS
jgi:hypothetical protein